MLLGTFITFCDEDEEVIKTFLRLRYKAAPTTNRGIKIKITGAILTEGSLEAISFGAIDESEVAIVYFGAMGETVG